MQIFLMIEKKNESKLNKSLTRISLSITAYKS